MSIITIQGKTLGTCVINEFLVLFTHELGIDRIYKVSQPDSITNISDTIILFKGNLGFDNEYLIQTLPFYENESIQKVYWIDGLNQPRVINIADTSYNDMNPTQFDFIQTLELNESVSVTKQYGGGSFKSGVIQYAFTYFNKNGAESNIFHTTPLSYISPIDRGGKVDEIINNTFKISLTNLESKFEYLRIYSIYRTSLDTTPEVRNLIDLKIDNSGKLSFIDNGLYGSIVSSDLLLYVGGEEVIPGCMSQKNNTLFLGNITTVGSEATPQSLEVLVSGSNENFSWSNTDYELLEGVADSGSSIYPYKPKSLGATDKIKHFKFDETYRFGIQGQYKSGKWSSPIWIGIDKKVNLRYKTWYFENNMYVNKTIGKYTISPELFDALNINGADFVKVRPVMVPLNYSERTIIAQGLANNTIAVVKNRFSSNPSSDMFAYPDYLFRNGGVEKTASEDLGLKPHYRTLNRNQIYALGKAEIMAQQDYNTPSDMSSLLAFESNCLFVDKNMVNFWSPEIHNNFDSISNYVKSSTKVGLYGFAFNTGNSIHIDVDSGVVMTEKSYSYNAPNYTGSLINYNRGVSPVSFQVAANRINFPMWSPAHYFTMGDGGPLKDADIVFTKFNKSGHSYFGANKTLKDGVGIERYELNINSPGLFNSDSTAYYKTNNEDYSSNSGNVLYSKAVEINYVGNTYKNLVTSDDTWQNTPNPIQTGMQVKYNTASHALFSFKQSGEYFSNLPRLKNAGETITSETFDRPAGWYGSGAPGFKTDVLDLSIFNAQGNLEFQDNRNSVPIFDIYTSVSNDPSSDDYTKYGGNSDDALYSNSWIPCGKSIAFQPGAVLEYTDGDTYIQRFDLLRVFPDDLNQIPQHTEIISFICESFINLDGRSDVNRYNTDSSLMTPTNYGLLNNVYSQKNNYFNYNILDPLLFNTTKFNNSIVWTKTKVAGAINDNWTNISMLSSIDLDGVYGEVSSINLFNNDLYAFQQKGVAKLLFNERVQQQASDGISVELTNGYKVPEYRYITNQYGCGDKWSITEGKQGVYFVDYINKSLLSIGDGIKDLGLTLGFKSWFNKIKASDKYLLSYDRNNNDLYIHNDINCLGYSEILQSFVSFYDYIGVPQMKNVWDNFISISYSDIQLNAIGLMSEDGDYLNGQDNTQLVDQTSVLNQTKIWLHNKGEYNKFYDVQQPFSVEYLFNPDPLNDKTFNTFEYRLNDQFIDWNHLEVANWYQYGELNDRQYLNSLKRKFNVNRVQLPRQSKTLDSNSKLIDLDTRNSLNRIRSTWAKLKLEHQNTDVNNNRKLDMQDLTITYTV